jgi:hypothetical protein
MEGASGELAPLKDKSGDPTSNEIANHDRKDWL